MGIAIYRKNAKKIWHSTCGKGEGSNLSHCIYTNSFEFKLDAGISYIGTQSKLHNGEMSNKIQ